MRGVNGFLNGGVDFSSGEPRLAVGLAITPMSSAMAKKVWPVFIATKVRNWVAENLQAATSSASTSPPMRRSKR